MLKFSENAIYCISILMFIVPLLGFPQTDKDARSFEKKVMQAVRDRESIEMPIVYLMPFDWHVVKMARYASYPNFYKGAKTASRYIYMFEFQDESENVIKEIILPLRFAYSSRADYSLRYTGIPYLSKEKFGRDAKFKIKRIPSTYRDGGNELEIELK